MVLWNYNFIKLKDATKMNKKKKSRENYTCLLGKVHAIYIIYKKGDWKGDDWVQFVFLGFIFGRRLTLVSISCFGLEISMLKWYENLFMLGVLGWLSNVQTCVNVSYSYKWQGFAYYDVA